MEWRGGAGRRRKSGSAAQRCDGCVRACVLGEVAGGNLIGPKGRLDNTYVTCFGRTRRQIDRSRRHAFGGRRKQAHNFEVTAAKCVDSLLWVWSSAASMAHPPFSLGLCVKSTPCPCITHNDDDVCVLHR